MLTQASLYRGSQAFTDFARVTPQTDLGSLNLNWREDDLPQWERTKHVHGLHPYLGKFIPQLVEIFLRKYARRVVVDPFVGCGTTLVEANVLGLESVGCDVSYFNCLLCRVKTGSYDLDLLRRELLDILTRAEFAAMSGEADEAARAETNAYLTSWYAPRSLAELVAYRRFIGEYHYQEVMQVVLSRAARSARLTTHFELDFPERPQTEPYYCRKHRRRCYPTVGALGFLRRYTFDTLERLQEFARLRKPARVEVLWGDAREADFPPCDTVITSPPYLGLIDYHEQHRYAYELLGLPRLCEREIGSATQGRGKTALAAYREGVKAVFARVADALVRDGYLVVIVHDRMELFGTIAEELGLRTEAVLERHVNRRTGCRPGEFFERAYIWRKAGPR